MYKIYLTDHFKKQLKRLLKKNRSLKQAVRDALVYFNHEHAISIGGKIFKLRLKGQNIGKSSGYRLYVFVIQTGKILAPVCIYAKNEKTNLSIQELQQHLETIKVELKNLL